MAQFSSLCNVLTKSPKYCQYNGYRIKNQNLLRVANNDLEESGFSFSNWVENKICYVRFLNMTYLCILNAKIVEENKNTRDFFRALLPPNGFLNVEF